jgi:hypothetical protein
MSFEILQHLDSLTPDGGSSRPNEGSYLCPVCESSNFKVNLNTGQYGTYGCTCAETPAGKRKIRDAIAPLTWEKPPRPSGKKTFTYDGLNHGVAESIVEVVREDDGNGKRQFYQRHWNRQRWVRGVPDDIKAQIRLYRIFSPVNEQAKGQRILLVEGEGKVDILLGLGIPATCAIGGAGKWQQYGYPNYLEDLEGYQVVLCPDRDTPGVKHCETVAADLEAHGVAVAGWLYAFPTSPLWNYLPNNRGADIADWIAEGATADEIWSAVEPRRLTPQPEQPQPEPLLTLDAVTQQLQTMARQGLPQSQVQVALIRLSKASGQTPNVLRGIYAALVEEGDRHLPEQSTFDELAAASQDDYDIAPLLPTLASTIGRVAGAYNQDAVAFTVPLLAAAASLLNPATRLVIGGPTDYQVSPIFWGGLVAEPGSIKSPIFKMALRPLHLLQAAANDTYTEALNQYKHDLRATPKDEDEPTAPRYRHYYHDSATVEAIQKTATEQRDHGTVVAPDELSALFNSFDQYKGGKGSDRDFWKSAADGAAVKIDRASSETRFVAQTSISVTGTIQPDALRSQMAGGDRDGFWSRFMWVRLPLRRLPAPGNAPKIDITSWLHSTYQRLEAMPAQQFRFTPDGQRMWDRWHEWIEDRRLETETPVERVLYPKYRDRAARVALIAHCLEYASQDKPVPAEIPTSTLEAAIKFAQYCLNQTRLLYADIGMSDALTGDLLRAWEWAQQQQTKGRSIIQPGDLQRSKRVKQGNGYAKTPYCRELLGQLVELGYLKEIDGGFAIAERVETPPNPPEIEKVERELKKVESVLNSQNPLPDSVSADTPPKVEKLKDPPVFSTSTGGRAVARAPVRGKTRRNGHSPPGDVVPLTDQELASSLSEVNRHAG